MASDLSDDFELIDSLDVAKQIVAEKQPDISRIKKWLDPTDYTAMSSEFRRHLSSKAPETGEWIRETSQFCQWQSSKDHGSIWIKAVPGAGKSVLAASMVDSLARNESVPVLCFFFRQVIEANRSPRSLLRDWLSQLLEFSEILQVSLWECVQANELESVSTTQLWEYLLAGLRWIDKAYCVIDALDEMTIDEDFLLRVNALGSFRPDRIKILITSRPKQYLQRLLKNPQVIHVSLEVKLVKRDISLFVRQRVADYGRDGVDPKIQEFLKDTICERSEGLFLYARLMLDQIEQSIKGNENEEHSIREMVVNLPVGLDEMYNRMLFEYAALTKVEQDIQILILQLVTHSARPMRLIEIAKVLETNHRAATDRDSKEIVRAACGPLLEIMEDEVVQILHHSFTEFLLDRRRIDRSTPATPQFPIIESTTAHREIALTCLSSLRSDAFGAYPNDDPKKTEVYASRYLRGRDINFDFRAVFLRYPLVEYAAREWPYHAKNYGIEDQHFFNILQEFCEPQSSHFRAWLALMSAANDSAVSFTNSTPLHVAAGYGLVLWTKYLIQRGMDINALDSSENTPLFWASKGGHSAVVDLLLKAGAKPDVDGFDGLKPLHVAASRNHVEVVKLLLAAGVSPTTRKPREVGRFCGNAPSSRGHHPLMYASQTGHVETVLEMIPFAKLEDLEQALCWSARAGHFQLMTALLENSKVSPDASYEGESVLMLAAASLEPKCVRVLLEKGASVQKVSRHWANVPGLAYHAYHVKPDGRTPLHSLATISLNSTTESAARNIMKMLLSAGADLEAVDSQGNTPLLLTIDNQFIISDKHNMLDMLLSAGANLCAKDSKGETLLHRACKTMCNTKHASQLLTHKALTRQARSSDGATPLHCAVKNIHCPCDIIQLLVDHGADINARDFHGNTALHIACKDHHIKKESILNILIHLGADVNLQNSLGQTCLHIFHCPNGFPEGSSPLSLVQSIIVADADLEIRDPDGMTALLYAVAKNRPLADVLLQQPKDKEASVSARTILKGKTALHLACQTKDPLDLVKTLVTKGADLNWTDNDGNTLLHEVAERFEGSAEDINLVTWLVEMGVPTKATNSRQQTAAHIMPSVYSEGYGSRSSHTRQTLISMLVRLDPQYDVNTQDRGGYTPLHYASAASESDTFNLIRLGAILNAKSFNLRTPLHCAARGRQSNIIAMLLHFGIELDQNIDINAADIDGRTALHDACRSSWPESVSLLVRAGADVNCKDKDSIKPWIACTEYIKENAIWQSMSNSGQKASTDLNIGDPFRPVPVAKDQSQQHCTKESVQHETVRIGVIAKMLVKAGADIEGPMQTDLLQQNRDLVATVRREAAERSSQRAGGIASANVERRQRYRSMDCPSRFIEHMDETTMDAVIALGMDFTRPDRSSDDGNAIIKIARFGLTELMRKIILSAKLLDDPTFTKTIAEEVPTGYYKVRPVLQVACDRRVWNMDMVRLLVVEGQVDVNAHQQVKETPSGRISPGPTALHVLASGNYWWQVDAIKFLVSSGSMVDVVNEKGQTPLELASTCEQHCTAVARGFFKPQCCEILLRLGADPNKPNLAGLTPLNMARHDSDIIKILLKHGADVNAGAKGALMSAVESGDVETLKIYLKNGADCNVPDTSANSNLRGGHPNLQKRYPLAVAAFPPVHQPWSASTSTEMMRLFLDHGAKVDVLINDDEPLLHFLFQHARSSLLRIFTERPNLDFNVRDQKGRTVFMAACASVVGSEAIGYVPQKELERLNSEYTPAFLLLADSERYGSSIDYLAVDNEGKHLIFYLLGRWDKHAARFFSISGVRALIHQKDSAGFSPLHRALKSRNISTCLRLIEDGNADLLEPDPNGDTALHHLYRCTYVGETKQSLPLIQKFLSLGGDINARNWLGETALLAHVASGYRPDPRWNEMSHLATIPFFITNGADVRAVKNDGATILHVLAERKTNIGLLPRNSRGEVDYNALLFSRFVDLGCDPLQEDNEGRTALDIAAAMDNGGILELYQRRKGA